MIEFAREIILHCLTALVNLKNLTIMHQMGVFNLFCKDHFSVKNGEHV